MAYRAIQWATGNVGKHAIRAMVDRPDIELVGVYVHSSEKAGRDAGEICGIGPLGVVATNDVEAILALDADVVVYAPLFDDIDQVCRLLESGKNVIDTIDYFYPRSLGSAVVARLEAACRAGGASLHGTGINPGAVSDQLALMLSGLSGRIESVEIDEFGDLSSYPAPGVVFDWLGFGKPPESAGRHPMQAILGKVFCESIDMVAAGMNVEFEGHDASHEVAVAKAPIAIAAGTIDEGTIAAQRFTWSGEAAGRLSITSRVTWVMSADELDPAWPRSADGWEIRIQGNPPVHCRLTLGAGKPSRDERRIGAAVLATAMHAINAIPTVCDAAPGIRTFLDLPMIAGHARQGR